MERKVYILENLGCANCAAKMESRIAALPGVQEATITYATKQLRIAAESPETLLPEMQRIANALEPDVVIRERTGRGGKRAEYTQDGAHHHHHEHECCDCGCEDEEHEHHHHHEHECCDCGCEDEEHEHHHHHEHECCDCGGENEEHAHHHHHEHEHRQMAHSGHVMPENLRMLLPILAGVVLFAAGEVLEKLSLPYAAFGVAVAAYLILGGEVLWTAVRNIAKGEIFDENFLMSIATLGAFAINKPLEAVGVMLFFRIGEYFEHVAVEKSRSQIMDAVDLRPEVVNLVDGESVRVIDAAEAEVGDILLIRPGDRIPLDGVVVEGESRLDTSAITGEPVPVKVTPGSEAISGCVNTSGVLHIRVEKVLEESMVTRILDSVENAAARKPQIDRFITRFARIYTPVVILLALATAILPSLVSGNWHYWVYTALTFLVMSCPCALVLSVPLAFFSGIGAGSRQGILFKGGVSLEAMSDVSAVVMDKTGTVTEGNFAVQHLVARNGRNEDEILTLCAACELNSTHPIGTSIVAEARARGLEVVQPERVEEVAGSGIRATLPDGRVLLCGNRRLLEGAGVDLEEHTAEGRGSEVLLAINGVLSGWVVISDTLKPDAKEAMAALKRMGMTTAMLTGDAERSAEAVAAELGVDEVHAKLLPQGKLEMLVALRQKYGAVMFVGDGINDAPVLAGADVGAAMGSGADAAIEAADVVFMTSSVSAIPQSISIARATKRIAWQNVWFALVIKIAVMILGLLGHASMWMAVFADTGVAMLCILNSIRILRWRG